MSAELPGSQEHWMGIPADGNQMLPVGAGSARYGPVPAGSRDNLIGAARAGDGAGPICRAAPGWFARLPGLRPRSRRPVILAGVAVVALLGGASAALAVTGPGPTSLTSSVHPANARPSTSPRGPGHGERRVSAWPGNGRFALGGDVVGAFPGHFAVARSGGGQQSAAIQTGRALLAAAPLARSPVPNLQPALLKAPSGREAAR